MKRFYTTLLGMFADEINQEELEKKMNVTDVPMENVDHGIGICYKSRKHRRVKLMNTTVISEGDCKKSRIQRSEKNS